MQTNIIPGLLVILFFCRPLIAGQGILRGAGASFPAPLYRKWAEAFHRATGHRIVYDACGSGEGISRFLEKKVGFAGTDAFLSQSEMDSAPAPVLHLPTCIGGVAVSYHLPADPQLRLTPEVLADIFLGRIDRWSNRKLRRLNPEITLPDLPITVIHRSDGSGTTFIFTHYLSAVSKSWSEFVGAGKTVGWPSGIGVEGNKQIAAFIKKIPGSIGALELGYAQANGFPTAALKNRNGRFIPPTLSSVSVTASSDLPDDTRVFLIDTGVADGYPISAFTYLIVYREQAYKGRSLKQAKLLTRFLWWLTHKGQAHAPELDKAPLPETVLRKNEAIIRRITFQGKPVFRTP